MNERDRLIEERVRLVTPGSSFLCSYPRSGSIWLRYLVYDVNWIQAGHWFLKKGHPWKMHRFTPQLELPAFPENYRSTRFDWKLIKTHLPARWTGPLIEQGRAVVLLRRPEDAFISAYRKRRNAGYKRNRLVDNENDRQRIERLEAQGPDAYCVRLINGWQDYVEGYLALADSSPGKVMFVTYEALKAHTVKTLGSIMRFLGHPADALLLARAVRNRDISRESRSLRKGYGKVNIGSGVVGGGESGLAPGSLDEIRRRLGALYREVESRAATELEK